MLVIGAAAVGGGAIALGALDPWQEHQAEAQDDPSQLPDQAPTGQYEPTLAETAPSGSGDGAALAAPDGTLGHPATPVPAPETPAVHPTWETSDAGMATSLGGSDVAVESVGGSHQVDAPKRKANKIRGEKKRP